MILSRLTSYISVQLSLVLDTSIFIGVMPSEIQCEHILLRLISGGIDNESGMSSVPIQVLSKARSYKDAEELAVSVHTLIGNKSGFVGVSDIQYCKTLMRPVLIGQNEDGFCIFSATYLLSGVL